MHLCAERCFFSSISSESISIMCTRLSLKYELLKNTKTNHDHHNQLKTSTGEHLCPPLELHSDRMPLPATSTMSLVHETNHWFINGRSNRITYWIVENFLQKNYTQKMSVLHFPSFSVSSSNAKDVCNVSNNHRREVSERKLE